MRTATVEKIIQTSEYDDFWGHEEYETYLLKLSDGSYFLMEDGSPFAGVGGTVILQDDEESYVPSSWEFRQSSELREAYRKVNLDSWFNMMKNTLMGIKEQRTTLLNEYSDLVLEWVKMTHDGKDESK